jgi:hypothetical protein
VTVPPITRQMLYKASSMGVLLFAKPWHDDALGATDGQQQAFPVRLSRSESSSWSNQESCAMVTVNKTLQHTSSNRAP